MDGDEVPERRDDVMEFCLLRLPRVRSAAA